MSEIALLRQILAAFRAEKAGSSSERRAGFHQPAAPRKPDAIEWLWPNRLAVGLNLLIGDRSQDALLAATDIVAHVTSGAGFPDQLSDTRQPAGVTILTSGDHPREKVRPFLQAAGADLGRIIGHIGVPRLDAIPLDDRESELNSRLQMISKSTNLVLDARLIVVDSAYLGISRLNVENVQATFEELADTAAAHFVAILLLHALGDSESKGHISDAVEGLPAAWLIVPDKEVPSRRLLLPIKDQPCSDGSWLAFTINEAAAGPRLAWQQVSHTVTAQAVLANRDRLLNALAQREEPILPVATAMAPCTVQPPKLSPGGPTCGFQRRGSATPRFG